MSPYPGGKHGPGHYSSGTAAQGLIFLRGVGLCASTLEAGNAQFNLSLPIREVGDTLFVHCAGRGLLADPVNGADWPVGQRRNTGNNGHRLFWREATNDSNDTFTVAANQNTNSVWQAASFGAPFFLENFQQSGFFPGSAVPNFPFKGIVTNATADTLVISISRKIWTTTFIPDPLPIVGAGGIGFTKIGNCENLDAVDESYVALGWQFAFQAVGEEVLDGLWTMNEDDSGAVFGRAWRYRDVAL